MPNWCGTYITMNGYKNNVYFLANKLDEWTSKNYKDSDFGTNWLGNIVLGSGVVTLEELMSNDYPRCRGWIEDYDINDINEDYAQLVIHTETAWGPMLKMWQMVVNKYNLNLEIIYSAEECGTALYWTNDPCGANTYIIDTCGNTDITETVWDASEKYVIEVLQDMLNTTEVDINNLLSKFEDSEYSDDISIYKWEYVDISEID